CVIMNPPYFKLRKDSRHAQVMKHVIHGQPNIYALFMAAAVELLAPHGEMVAITPRGYFSGPYFKRFRKWFFDRMTARRIHLFESRTDTFREDAVLQENVILHAERSGEKSHVALTSTMGRDLSDLKSSVLPYASIVDDSNGDHVIRVTTSGFEQAVVSVVDGLPNRFRDSGLDISTGPVVSFRATEFLRATRTEQTAPLLWLHNVRPFITRYPQHSSKPEHIQISDESKRLLVPAKTYVLLKRFSAKEEKRRLVAGILTPADTYAPWVGLENHLNYVYRKGGDLTRPEAFGLAAYFNSALVDVYFRTISGNTQVNATEIRGMPIPSGNTIANIGVEIQKIETHDRREVERVVCRALDIPPSLTEILLNLAP
ncbi:MAG: Eco57I restriction-modification methylase domain-containing protein, partial [Planctomycetota bacterium]|nr:Eco57I restriction-modification methylase domain-containing protein [Planctomycetota bacterium]